MVIDVDSATYNMISFRPISRALRYRKLDYAEPHPASARLANKTPCPLILLTP